MKNSIIYLLIAVAGLFSSCEKVIKVNLDDADKKVVIEGKVTNRPGDCSVMVSRTKNFGENNSADAISDAEVTITNATGEVFTLSSAGNGTYTHESLTGNPGDVFTLHVKAEGADFTATSAMPSLIPLDSMYVESTRFFDEDELFANVVFQDSLGERNYYRFTQKVNGERTKGFFIMDDDLSDGKQFRSTLYFFREDDEEPFKTGDVFDIEMQCISQQVYDYWFSLEQSATGSGNSATPANPVTNIQGGALGYFSAHTVQTMQAVAP